MDSLFWDLWLYDSVVDPGAISGELDLACSSCGETSVVEYNGSGIYECPVCGQDIEV